MIVYRDQRSRADPRRLLSQLRALTGSYRHTPPHEVARDALLAAGTLETAVADTIFSDSDGVHPLVQTLRGVSVSAGHVLWHIWRSSPEAERWWNQLTRQLETVRPEWLPHQVDVSVPEGYSQYAVYPEMYLEAARRYRAEQGPVEAVCLGLRSIGTSLSAVVAAVLEELGCRVRTATLRPRGHPYSRFARPTPELRRYLEAREGTRYLIIDEGPGISGSSMSGTADMLREWGIPDDRITLFPSWATDGSHLRSDAARLTWSRHRQFTASFEDVWLRSGRLSGHFPGALRDLSAGEWRSELYARTADYPAVQPQHERRKYLIGPAGPGSATLLSFVGLGEQGKRRLERAHRLAAAGFTPAPETLAQGFLSRRFVAGTPVTPRTGTEALLERIAAYLAHLSREHSAEPTVSDACLAEMTAINLSEGLGDFAKIPNERPQNWAERVVALDGRMLPHEWISTANGFLKVDALDHHDDHFFPGCQDIAWDLAAAALELDLEDQQRRDLVARYRRLSGDQAIARRLPFYAGAYLAFRLGYSMMAVSALGTAPDAERFARQVTRYTRLIERELAEPTGGRWDG